MKKLLMLTVLCTTLSACNANDSKLSFSELKIVPNALQSKINPATTLQMINTKDDIAYIIYRTKKAVASDLEAQGDTLKIKLNESKTHKKTKQHVYKLTLDPEHEIIDVYVNGKSTAFDNITN
ncbi:MULTISPECIES: hypothetical protein [unclassified Exiguobacterium]|uniref:hypothetical protein n=1 Tax=unclassified Exiguobacterium TaxID=2644629 RepID=UPI0006FF0800|nr:MULTISPECIES: hypothetical protein [unclassified Exiguobacterium]KQS45035.1 hypothetical protein ASG02_03050 [Exiguobacterium sp. Leaf196]